MRLIILLTVLLGLLMYALIVATATPSDKASWDAYEQWKERHKHGKMD